MNLSDLHNPYVLRPRFLAANYTAKPGDMCYVDSGSTAITVTLPASPNVDTYVGVWDANNNANANNITIERNGQTIQGVAEDWVINVDSGRVDLVFDGVTWQVAFVTVGGLNQTQVDARFSVLAGLASINVQSGTSYTIQASDAGKVVVFTNGSAIAVTLPDDLDDFFQFTVVQAGAGVPTVTRSGTDTINGAATGVTPSDQWKGAYFTQYASGSWLALL